MPAFKTELPVDEIVLYTNGEQTPDQINELKKLVNAHADSIGASFQHLWYGIPPESDIVIDSMNTWWRVDVKSISSFPFVAYAKPVEGEDYKHWFPIEGYANIVKEISSVV